MKVTAIFSRNKPDKPKDQAPYVRVIEPKSGWRFIDFNEVWQYRDLLYFLVRREIKVRYAQSVLGVGWAVFQPIFFMIVFTLVFGNLAKIGSDGAPYAVFSYAALVPWTYFANSLTDASGSLISNSEMLTKVYIPRLIMPLSAVLAKLVDFTVALVLVFVLMAWFGVAPTIWALFLPVLILLMVISATGLGLWFTSLAVQYRDFKYSLTFGIQGMMYLAPVAYPASKIPDEYQLLYAINPMVGVIEGFRSALLGTNPMPWDLLAVGTASAIVIAISGSFYFRRMERVFADVV